ncbi:DUF4224 domain-containing protein [Pseudomonas aeruginosa]|uniref:DUF4224 domain-containing protein n=1 Tax=Pseudomonas aeruginosa TaxID=287 RepID=UPI000F54154A|nr:DUF4224 domain-containing protein [Pseudomonas aeruginosa]RQA20089.1 hypothetical protein IPC507_26715 [Pseudomonas aeruginosa]
MRTKSQTGKSPVWVLPRVVVVYPSKQIEWLNRYGWKYAVTAANRPIVGRVYARLKLAGVKPTMEATEKWSLDLSRVR